ncbi:MAG: glycogen synthase GlgA [Oscillospiraceae bacterium]|nr:glycogen synthase GlgA [Oscillospiraceae bacterium]
MNVLFATSECAPFVKTGGLGDVAGSLPQALREKNVDARVVLPLYNCIPEKFKEQMKYIDHIYIDMAWRKQYCGIFELKYNNCIYYFIDNKFYFNGDKPYDFIHLDCEKFIFFSKAALSILPTIGFRPDVINCNDWQTGPIPVFLDTFQDNPFYQGIKTVITIHNLKFQGRWDFKGIKDAMGISDYYFTPDKMEYYKDANLLKGGMVYANKISTVSDTYAVEITTPHYGEGLDSLLRARRNDLVGIVNGISYDDWNPAKDGYIVKKYTSKTIKAGKAANKAELQREMGLPEDPDKMVIGIVSRLTDQKGFDLIAYKLEELCNGGCQIVVLGTGDEQYENLFRHYSWKYPERFAARITYSNEMSHKIYAGCDAFLMPSAFEPCGLSQIISMHYGTLPIVRETGGLRDTVTPYNKYTGEGTGFSFANYNADEMLQCIWNAMDVYYNNKDAWYGMVKQAMAADYSWNVSAEKYIDMYCGITGLERPKAPELKKKMKKKPVKQPEHLPDFAEIIAADAAASEAEFVKTAAEPKIIEIPNPYPEEPKKTAKKPAAKKTATKSTKAATAKASERLAKAAETKSKAGKKTTKKSSK